MADLGNRTNVNTAINLLLDDAQANEAIQPSDHNTLLQNILDTLANGLSVTLRTNPETGGQDIEITSGDKLKYKSSTFFSSLITDTLTADRTLTLPNNTGTVALLSDVQNIMNTNGLILGGDFTHDLNEKNLVFDDGFFRLTNGSLGVLGSFNATHDGATGQDVATFISSLTNPIMVLSNTYEAVAIGTTGPATSAILDIESTSKGVLFPRMTTTQRNAITTPEESMFIYNTTDNRFEFRSSGGTWDAFGGGNTIYSADGTISADRIVSLGSKKLTFNPTTGDTTDLLGCNVSIKTPTGVKGLSNNGTQAFGIYDINENVIWQFLDNGKLIGEGSFILNRGNLTTYNSDFLVQGKTSFLASGSGSAYFGGWATSGGNNITAMYEDGRMVIGAGSPIGSEKISLQGHTIIKGLGTTTGTTLALYDAQGTPAKNVEFVDNGKVRMFNLPTSATGLSSGDIYNDNGTLKIV